MSRWRHLALALAGSSAAVLPAPAGTRVERDISYGPHARQRFDLYAPEGGAKAPRPVVFMVHGGAWRIGDKEMARVVENKVARWVPRGVLFVSTNYRMLPEADVQTQADDVARALARAQQEVARWGGDASRFVLMGHSAGAHLVALLGAAPERAVGLGARPWLGVIALDSAALDVPAIMHARHLPLYDEAFGRDPARWRAASPFHQLSGTPGPFLGVCSSLRRESCAQAEAFAAEAKRRGGRALVLPVALSHREINERLGEDPRYTAEVERFLAGLDDSLRHALAP